MVYGCLGILAAILFVAEVVLFSCCFTSSILKENIHWFQTYKWCESECLKQNNFNGCPPYQTAMANLLLIHHSLCN